MNDKPTHRLLGPTKTVLLLLVKGVLEIQVPVSWEPSQEQVTVGNESFLVWPGGLCRMSVISSIV